MVAAVLRHLRSVSAACPRCRCAWVQARITNRR